MQQVPRYNMHRLFVLLLACLGLTQSQEVSISRNVDRLTLVDTCQQHLTATGGDFERSTGPHHCTGSARVHTNLNYLNFVRQKQVDWFTNGLTAFQRTYLITASRVACDVPGTANAPITVKAASLSAMFTIEFYNGGSSFTEVPAIFFENITFLRSKRVFW